MSLLNNAFRDFFGSTFYTELDILKSKLPAASFPSTVQEKDVIIAHLILDSIVYHNSADLFLGCACVNLLCRYANDQKSKSIIKYDFKMYLGDIIDSISIVRDNKIKVGYDKPNTSGAYLIINFDDFQFSYWYQKNSDKVLELSKNQTITWDGHRKQPIAREILWLALEHLGISDISTSSESLRSIIDDGLKEHKNGTLKLVSGIPAKNTDDTTENKLIDSLSKNYFREKLREACGRLVLLKAKFKRSHEHYITFTTVRPYVRGIKTTTICNHLNIFHDDINGVVDISTLIPGRSYCIVAYCEEYKNESGRMGIRIAKDIPHSPIVLIDDVWMIPRSTFNRCYRFRIEEYLMPKEAKLLANA